MILMGTVCVCMQEVVRLSQVFCVANPQASLTINLSVKESNHLK